MIFLGDTKFFPLYHKNNPRFSFCRHLSRATCWCFSIPFCICQSSGIKKLEKLEHLVKAATWLHECKPTSPLLVSGSQFSGLLSGSMAINFSCCFDRSFAIAKVQPPTGWSLHVYAKEYDLAVATYKEAVETLRPTPLDAIDGII